MNLTTRRTFLSGFFAFALGACFSQSISGALARDGIDPVIIDRANQWFNNVTAMSGVFSQRNHAGSIAGGRFYLLRPGRVRFIYDEPATLDIVADGRQVAIRNTARQRQEVYPLNQTPLRFFLRGNVDLASQMQIRRAYYTENDAIISFEDNNTLTGRHLVTVVFDRNFNNIKQWIIIDPNGHETSVTLGGLTRHEHIDPTFFVILQDRHMHNNYN